MLCVSCCSLCILWVRGWSIAKWLQQLCAVCSHQTCAAAAGRYMLVISSAALLALLPCCPAVLLQLVGEESGADCSSLSSIDTPAWPAGKEPVAKLRFQVRAASTLQLAGTSCATLTSTCSVRWFVCSLCFQVLPA
jgi:hypothetical protein